MAKKGILWLSHFVPYPPKGGAYQRSYHLMRELSKGFEVDLIAVRHKKHTHPVEELERADKELGSFCRNVKIVDLTSQTSGPGSYLRAATGLLNSAPATVDLYRSPQLQSAIELAINEADVDAVHLDTISLVPYAPIVGDRPVVLNHHNIESFMIRRRIQREPNYAKRFYFYAEAKKLESFEKQWVPRFVSNLVVSEADRDKLVDMVPGCRTDVIENGVDTEYFLPNREEASEPKLLFVGRLDQYANVDAMLHFINNIWPLLRKTHPSLQMEIAGNNPPRNLIDKCDASNGLLLRGYVDDVRPLFERAWAVVCPMREGAGTRLKVLDAMAMGLPLVATSMACEGIDISDGCNVLVADSPAEFANAVTRVLREKELRKEIGENARHTILDQYAWTRIGEKLRAVYERYT